MSSESVVKQFKKAGHEIAALDDVHNLDLKSVDSVARLNRIRAVIGLGMATGPPPRPPPTPSSRS